MRTLSSSPPSFSLLAGILFRVLPALRAGSKKTLLALRDGGRGSTIGRERHRARSVLVIVQVALALVLLVGSGLMVRSFQQLPQSTLASMRKAS